MRIVEVCPYDLRRPGGVQNHVRDLAAWCRAEGHEVLVVAPRPRGGEPVPGVRHVGYSRMVAVHGTVSEVCLASRREIEHLQRELGFFAPELVHFHNPQTPFLPWQLWRRAGRKVVSLHATLPARAGVSGMAIKAAARFFLGRADRVIVPSLPPLASVEPVSMRREPIVLPPAIDLRPWAAGARTPPGGRSLRAVFLGRLEARKGVAVLLAAWREVNARLPDARLTVAGGGALEPLVREAMATRWGGSISFMPEPSSRAARQLVGEADIFVAPALYGESFGLVLAEAMAAGAVPVAAANAGYCSVMTGPGADLLFPPGDHGALARMLVQLAGQPERLRELAGWGRQHAARFDIAAVGPRFLEVFESAMRA